MTEFKKVFENAYGEGSFNDEFLIDAISAEALAKKYAELILAEAQAAS